MACAASVPSVGSMAPDFTLTSQEGKPVNLKDYRGSWVVLYFYPKDFTNGCTVEAHNFQRDQEKYKENNTVVLGVSVDSTDSHKQFCTKEGLNFKLLADTDHKVSSKYGLLTNSPRSPARTAGKFGFRNEPKIPVHLVLDACHHLPILPGPTGVTVKTRSCLFE